jgi:hypothetical protein
LFHIIHLPFHHNSHFYASSYLFSHFYLFFLSSPLFTFFSHILFCLLFLSFRVFLFILCFLLPSLHFLLTLFCLFYRYSPYSLFSFSFSLHLSPLTSLITHLFIPPSPLPPFLIFFYSFYPSILSVLFLLCPFFQPSVIFPSFSPLCPSQWVYV